MQQERDDWTKSGARKGESRNERDSNKRYPQARTLGLQAKSLRMFLRLIFENMKLVKRSQASKMTQVSAHGENESRLVCDKLGTINKADCGLDGRLPMARRHH